MWTERKQAMGEAEVEPGQEDPSQHRGRPSSVASRKGSVCSLGTWSVLVVWDWNHWAIFAWQNGQDEVELETQVQDQFLNLKLCDTSQASEPPWAQPLHL